MMKRLSCILAVGLLTVIGCRADHRNSRSNEAPAAPEATPPEAMGGGPTTPGWSHREAAIDRLSHARCQARERCGAIGVARDHTSYGECLEVSRADLRGSFGAATCQEYDDGKLDACARKLADIPCGQESKLSEDCVESKLCK